MTRVPLTPADASPESARGPVKPAPPASPASETFTRGSWAGQRWLRLVELDAPPDPFAAGLTIARSPAMRDPVIEPGRAAARVAEKGQRQHTPVLSLDRITEEQWGRVIDAMGDQAFYAARLLTGEVPTSIEDLFRPLGLRLFPDAAAELGPSCSCAESKSAGSPWCRHACALAAFVADRLREDAFLIFRLRGLGSEDLIDRLRSKRAAGVARGRGRWFVRVPSLGSPAYLPQIDRLAPPDEPLTVDVEAFWRVGAGLDEVDTTPAPPAVPHALLRRLGPSPFPPSPGARPFPLIGLLATCYDVMTRDAMGGEAARDESGDPAPGG